MGLYSNIVSTTKEIKQIRTFVEGTAKDIKSIWTFVGNERKLIYPSNNIIVNLSGASKYEDNTIWPAGVYEVDVLAGASKCGENGNTTESLSGKVKTTISVTNNFIIRAYCGSRADNQTTPGTNPYTGQYKVNGNISYGADVPSVNHIFGNAGSCNRIKTGTTEYNPSSGNCLGDGAVAIQTYNGSTATGAGSCLHFLPVGGTFGTDYLCCFHATAGGGGNGIVVNGIFGGNMGASGSAYGGAGSGSSNSYTYTSSSYAGGATPYGTGGAGQSGGSSQTLSKPGNNGNGIGHGYGGGVFEKGCLTPGAACYFNGTEWLESSLVGNAREDGHIIVKYLGNL